MLVQGFDDEVLVVFALVAGLFVAVAVHVLHSQTNAPNVAAAGPVDSRSATRRGAAEAEDRASLDNCAICLDAVAYPCSTNCGHVFCTQCIVSYFQHTRGGAASSRHQVTCPLCRREITLLERRGWTAEEAQSPEGAERQASVNAYNIQVAGGPRSWIAQLRDLPHLLAALRRDFLFANRRLTAAFIFYCVKLGVAAVLFLVYLVSPVDIFPEAVLGIFGYIDDIAALVVFLLFCAAMFRRRLLARQQQAEQQRLEGVMRTVNERRQ